MNVCSGLLDLMYMLIAKIIRISQVTVIHGDLSAFQEEIQSVHHVVRTLVSSGVIPFRLALHTLLFLCSI